MRKCTVKIAHEGDPQWVIIETFGMRSNHSPPTALEHCTIKPNEETEKFQMYTHPLCELLT